MFHNTIIVPQKATPTIWSSQLGNLEDNEITTKCQHVWSQLGTATFRWTFTLENNWPGKTKAKSETTNVFHSSVSECNPLILCLVHTWDSIPWKVLIFKKEPAWSRGHPCSAALLAGGRGRGLVLSTTTMTAAWLGSLCLQHTLLIVTRDLVREMMPCCMATSWITSAPTVIAELSYCMHCWQTSNGCAINTEVIKVLN